jgi:hypothetical protein
MIRFSNKTDQKNTPFPNVRIRPDWWPENNRVSSGDRSVWDSADMAIYTAFIKHLGGVELIDPGNDHPRFGELKALCSKALRILDTMVMTTGTPPYTAAVRLVGEYAGLIKSLKLLEDDEETKTSSHQCNCSYFDRGTVRGCRICSRRFFDKNGNPINRISNNSSSLKDDIDDIVAY